MHDESFVQFGGIVFPFGIEIPELQAIGSREACLIDILFESVDIRLRIEDELLVSARKSAVGSDKLLMDKQVWISADGACKMAINVFPKSEMRLAFRAIRRSRQAAKEIEAQQIVEMLVMYLLKEADERLSGTELWLLTALDEHGYLAGELAEHLFIWCVMNAVESENAA